ncbi:MAG TPA: hypothetical protein PK559_05850 [Ignavibacteriaceae bacterium]|nr:hypothetical protein [Ignavibacteriaceae bacterium]
MGNQVLIFVMGTLFTFLIVNSNLNRQLTDQFGASMNYYEEIQARNIGNSMVALLSASIADDPNYRVEQYASRNLFNGTTYYTARDTVIAGDSLISLNVTAHYMQQSKSMNVILIKPRPSMLPPIFGHTLVSGGNMSLSGNTTISSSAGNVSLITNQGISLSGAGTRVRGFVGYGTTISGQTATNIQPVSNPDGLPPASLISPLTIPTIIPSNFIGAATQVYAGDYSLASSITLGSVTDPAIIYVGGNLSVGSGARIGGSIIFLVNGTISINGNAAFVNTSTGSSDFAFYSGGNINVSGGATVYAQLFSMGNISFTGNSSIVGNAVARGTISLSGGSNINMPASAHLTDPIWGSPPTTRQLSIRSYYE